MAWKTWLRIPTGPVFWIVAVQSAWTISLVFWILYAVDRHGRLPEEGWWVLASGIVLLAVIFVGVTVISVHMGRQVAHNRKVKDFISQVSHELRSPLATVKLHLETMQLRRLSPAQQRQCLDTAMMELRRLESGIEDILTASRIERQKLRIAVETVDLVPFLTRYVEQKLGAVQARGAGLTFASEGVPDLTVAADPVLLRQVLDNLVDNAVVHGQPGVQVSIELGEQSRCAVISVRDDGPGLPRRELRRVFRMFYRAAPSGGRPQRRGTGLGLFIVSSVARAHGGRAWVESNGEGTGCTFRVALPLAETSNAAPTDRTEQAS
jgi:signal transduction histidine kinase